MTVCSKDSYEYTIIIIHNTKKMFPYVVPDSIRANVAAHKM